MSTAPSTFRGNSIVLLAGWLVDGQGGPILDQQYLTIENGSIQSLTPVRGAHRPDRKFLDLSHATILPALMDAHVHLAFSGTMDEAKRKAQLTASCQTIQKAIGKHIAKHMQSGIMAVRDAGDRHGAVLRAKPQNDDHSGLGPHVAATCWAWHSHGRYGRMIGRTPGRGEDLYRAMSQGLGRSDHIKIINSGINSLDRYGHQTPPQFSLTQLRTVARLAAQKRLPVMVHANGESAVRMALEAGCDSIEHGYFMGAENLKHMADTHTFWVPTAVPMAALAQTDAVSALQADVARRTLDHQLAQVELGIRSGVAIALGTDAGSMGVDHGAAVRQELRLLMTAGMPLTEAIRCAALNAACLMRLEKRGALLPGWQADFIVVAGGPDKLPESLDNIEAMCIRGSWVVEPRPMD